MNNNDQKPADHSACQNCGGEISQTCGPVMRCEVCGNDYAAAVCDEPTAAERSADFAAVESPHRGPELVRKLMHVAIGRGHFRRYFSLRRSWVRAMHSARIL